MSILCYHSISDELRWSLNVTARNFEAHCAWIAQHRRARPLEDAIGQLTGSGRLRDATLSITFDDGYAGLYSDALPVLTRYGLPATVFVVTGTLTGETKALDWIDEPLGGSPQTLTGEQIGEMSARGVSFGSHSHTHPDLTSLGEAECELELRRSREVLEDVVGTRVHLLAYPRGLHDERVRRAARCAGFTHAFATGTRLRPPDPYAIPRTVVYAGHGVDDIRRRTSWWFAKLRFNHAFRALRQRAA